MKRALPHMTISETRPGIILFDGDPLTGTLAGVRAKDIARACNSALLLAAALAAVEWSATDQHGDNDPEPACPSCGYKKRNVHHDDNCQLAAALRAYRGEAP